MSGPRRFGGDGWPVNQPSSTGVVIVSTFNLIGYIIKFTELLSPDILLVLLWETPFVLLCMLFTTSNKREFLNLGTIDMSRCELLVMMSSYFAILH